MTRSLSDAGAASIVGPPQSGTKPCIDVCPPLQSIIPEELFAEHSTSRGHATSVLRISLMTVAGKGRVERRARAIEPPPPVTSNFPLSPSRIVRALLRCCMHPLRSLGSPCSRLPRSSSRRARPRRYAPRAALSVYPLHHRQNLPTWLSIPMPLERLVVCNQCPTNKIGVIRGINSYLP